MGIRTGLVLVGLAVGHVAWGQAAPAAKSCTVQHFLASDANLALAAHKFAEAATLYQGLLDKNPDSSASKYGLVRSLLGQGKLDEAAELATKFAAKSPEDALLADALGDVRFRRGEIAEAAAAFNAAMHDDPCLGRVHFDVARYQTLAANFLTAQKQIDLAHRLAPEDEDITAAFDRVHRKPVSPEEQIAKYEKRLAKGDVDAEQKTRIENHIKQLKAQGNGNCQMAEPVQAAKIKLLPNLHENNTFSSVGVEVELNGNKRRLILDTGASGLTISRSAAAKAGLVPEADTRIGGIGDEGSKRGFIAHVDTLRLGGMEFHQCEVEVIDSRESDFDGLLGTDVFGQWLVTVDIPLRELRLAPLPKRPDGTAADMARLETDGADGATADSVDPRDRYVTPEMSDWTPVYRHGHDIIFPTKVNDLPQKLFLMDTGAFSGNLSTPVAKQVGNLVAVDTIVKGISGQVRNVFTVDKQVTLDFAGVKQLVRGITVMDMRDISRGQGYELTGIIGFSTLRELIISIDYRDNLVKVVFDPKHGFHSTGRMEY